MPITIMLIKSYKGNLIVFHMIGSEFHASVWKFLAYSVSWTGYCYKVGCKKLKSKIFFLLESKNITPTLGKMLRAKHI